MPNVNVVDPVVYVQGYDSEGNYIRMYWPTPRIATTRTDFDNINHWLMRDDARENDMRMRLAVPLMPPWKDDLVALFPTGTMRRQPVDPDAPPADDPERNPAPVAVRPLLPMLTMGDLQRGKIITGKVATAGSRPDGYRVIIDKISESYDWASGVGTTIYTADDHAQYMATFPRIYTDPEDAPGPAVLPPLNLAEIFYEESSTYDDMNFTPGGAPDTETDDIQVGGFAASRMSTWSPDSDGEWKVLVEYRETWSIIDVLPPLPNPSPAPDDRPLERRRYQYKYRIEFHSVTDMEGYIEWGPLNNYYSGGASSIILPYLKQTKTMEFRGKFYRASSSENLSGAVIKFYTVLPELGNQDMTLDTAAKTEVASINVASLPTNPNNAQTISFKFTPRVAVDPGTGVGYTLFCYRCECGPETYFQVATVSDPVPLEIKHDIIAGKINDGASPGEYETGYTSTMESSDWVGAIGAVVTTPEEHSAYMNTFPRDEGPENIADFLMEETARDDRDTYGEMAPDTAPITETSAVKAFGAHRRWSFEETSRERTYTQTWTISAVQEPTPPATEYRYKYRAEISDITVVKGDAIIDAMFGGGSVAVVVEDPEEATIEYGVNLAAILPIDRTDAHTGETSGMVIKFYTVQPVIGNPNQTLDTSTREEIGSISVASLVNSPGNAQKFTFNFTPLTAIDPTTTATYTIVAWRCECGDASSYSLYQAVEDINDGKRSGLFVQDDEGKTLPNPPAPWGAYV